MKQCPNCGAECAPATKFCGECGARFLAEAPSPETSGPGISLGNSNLVRGDVVGRKETVNAQNVYNIHHHGPAPEAEKRRECVLKIAADVDCRVFVDGRHVADLAEGTIESLPLPRGIYLVKFIGTECADDTRSKRVTLSDIGEFVDTELRPIRDARLQKKRQERERQQAEAADLVKSAHAHSAEDPERRKKFRKAAEMGNIEAQFFLAKLYEEGVGVSIDRNEAIKWYRMAAENRYGPTGDYYYRGRAEDGLKRLGTTK